jgi:hypothetical protein
VAVLSSAALSELRNDVAAHLADVLEPLELGKVELDLEVLLDGHMFIEAVYRSLQNKK